MISCVGHRERQSRPVASRRRWRKLESRSPTESATLSWILPVRRPGRSSGRINDEAGAFGHKRGKQESVRIFPCCWLISTRSRRRHPHPLEHCSRSKRGKTYGIPARCGGARPRRRQSQPIWRRVEEGEVVGGSLQMLKTHADFLVGIKGSPAFTVSLAGVRPTRLACFSSGSFAYAHTHGRIKAVEPSIDNDLGY